MRPLSDEIVRHAVQELRTYVAPAVSNDGRVASRLRSICAALLLVADRIPLEPAFLMGALVRREGLCQSIAGSADLPPDARSAATAVLAATREHWQPGDVAGMSDAYDRYERLFADLLDVWRRQPTDTTGRWSVALIQELRAQADAELPLYETLLRRPTF